VDVALTSRVDRPAQCRNLGAGSQLTSSYPTLADPELAAPGGGLWSTGGELDPLQQLRNMIVSGNPQNDVLNETARKACADLSDTGLQEALSGAVAEIIVGRQLGQDVFGARATALAVLDKIERAKAERRYTAS